MSVLGIIAEYNPFHNGHLLHIEKSKALTKAHSVITVMSGNFVQRGEPAFINKYSRTEMALKGGADIVLELPLISASSSAEYFAEGAISILHKTGVVDSVCFGSECGDLEKLKNMASLLINESADFKNQLKGQLKSGISFPKARENALKESETIIAEPNNILAIEYLKALSRLNSHIVPYTIKREVAPYNSEEITGGICSAAAIRKAAREGRSDMLRNVMPDYCYGVIKEAVEKETFALMDNLSHIFHYIISTNTASQLSFVQDMTEGLENRIVHFSEQYYLLSEIIRGVKTKRYTMTKINRAVLHTILNVTKKEFSNYYSHIPYIRVLGFKRNKEELLSRLVRSSCLPVITNLKNAERALDSFGLTILNKEIVSTDIYNLAINNLKPEKKSHEYSMPLIII